MKKLHTIADFNKSQMTTEIGTEQHILMPIHVRRT